MSVLMAQAISKSFGRGVAKQSVLHSASLNVSEGEFVTILGPSGSGKSTLLNICGLIEPLDEGSLMFKQHSLSRLSEDQRTEYRRQHIGFIFQSFNLVPVMSVYGNVEFPLMLLNWSEQDRKARVMDILTQVGLAEFANKKPEQLSGGQCQRVAIARALVKRPSLIIADEPTASLDADTAMTVVEVMKNLANSQGTACLVATHDHRLLPHSDAVLHLDHGKVVKDSPSQLMTDNAHLTSGVSL